MPFNIDLNNIKDWLDSIQLENLLPDLTNFESSVLSATRLALLLGPLVVLGLGVLYLTAAPKEANHTVGYRCWFGMGSVQAWQFTQKLAGGIFLLLGLVLAVVAAGRAASLAQLELMDALLAAGKQLVRQAVAVLIAVVCINVAVFARYDRKGERRASWRELLGRDD